VKLHHRRSFEKGVFHLLWNLAECCVTPKNGTRYTLHEFSLKHLKVVAQNHGGKNDPTAKRSTVFPSGGNNA